MAHKISDLAVKTGSYTDAQNQVKGRYENIGSLMQGDDGMFLILKRTFNPAGVPNPDNKDSVIVSCFEQKNDNQQAPQQQNQQQNNQQQGGYQNNQQQQHGGYQNNQQQQHGGYQNNRG
jgi:hypothetical protein